MRKCRHVEVACGCCEKGNEGASLAVPLWGGQVLESLRKVKSVIDSMSMSRFQAEVAIEFRCLHSLVVETLVGNVSIIRSFLSIQGTSSFTPMDVS